MHLGTSCVFGHKYIMYPSATFDIRATFDISHKGHVFMKKGHQKFHLPPPPPPPFFILSVLHQNKALYNCRIYIYILYFVEIVKYYIIYIYFVEILKERRKKVGYSE